MTTLVKTTYKENEITREEVVSVDSERFVQLLQQGIDKIVKAKPDAKIGVIGSVKALVYRDDKETHTVNINYDTNNGDAITISKFKPFAIRGYQITVESTKYGDILCVDLKKSKYAIINRTEANDMIYAIRNIQEFNDKLVGELDRNDENAEQESEQNAKVEKKPESALPLNNGKSEKNKNKGLGIPKY